MSLHVRIFYWLLFKDDLILRVLIALALTALMLILVDYLG